MSLFAIFLSSLALAQAEPNLSFRYVPHEGAEARSCTHERIRDLPDWRVRCDGLKKEFVAHVIVRHYHQKERSSIEILYWVTDRGEQKEEGPRFHSSTAWVNLRKPGEASSVSLAQGIENDYASLVMEWRSP